MAQHGEIPALIFTIPKPVILALVQIKLGTRYSTAINTTATGNWNGDGTDTIGVFRPGEGKFYLKNDNDQGTADVVFAYGLPGDQPVTGDWNNDGIDTVGVYRNNTFYLRNANTAGNADLAFALGNPGDLPVAGDWDGLPSQVVPTNTPAPTSTPTRTPTAGPTPTNPPTPTPTPAGVFSSASFTYDGDGKRVKSAMTTNLGTTTTYFVGAHYELTNGVITKYYYAGAQRIAMRNNGTVFFTLGDHLGSTSLTTFANGSLVSELRYKAWGEVRYASGNTPTKYTYTGQYSDSYINLLWYGSRHYDPELGRFTSPDSIVPLASQGVQAWDRYAYVNNNPVRYNDPTGHCPLCLTAVIGGAIGGIVGAVGYTAYVAATGREFNSTHFWMATGGGAVAGALIGTGVGIAAGVGVAETTAAAVGVGELACADGDCANEANALVKMGEDALESPEAQSLVQKISNTATQNPDSPWVSLGKNGVYQKDNYTYFELPQKAWQILSDAGDKFVEGVNGQFMYDQMAAGKNFSINLMNGDPGRWTRFEMGILDAAVKAGEFIEVVKNHVFIAK